MPKANCWEVMHCHHANHGMEGCPAFLGTHGAAKLNGVHGGKNAGRACWVVAGTRCGDGKPSGEFASKEGNCMKCNFYIQVRDEEGATGLKNGIVLQQMLKT